MKDNETQQNMQSCQRLSCLPEQLVQSSEQFVLMDIKGVVLGAAQLNQTESFFS